MGRKHNALPGFGLSMGFTLLYLGFIVLVPVATLLLKGFGMSWADIWDWATRSRAVAAYKLTFGASFIAATINATLGSILAWVLTRYHFPFKKLIDSLVDIPFALPTAVAGLTLANLFTANGWLGQWLVPAGIHGAYSRLGVVIALTFVSLPFVVRTLQPVIETMEREVEEAAATLGASRLRTVFTIIIPTLLPAIITGFALSLARAIGEYGSVIFISSNLPNQTEIAPFVIVTLLEEYEYQGAIVIALVLLVASFSLLAVINILEKWTNRING